MKNLPIARESSMTNKLQIKYKAFSLIELLMVMSVGLCLMLMAVPMFSRIARKSKVQQTAETIVAAFNMAKTCSNQSCRSSSVVVYFGDDFSTVNTKPVIGVLPKYGNIEIWSAIPATTTSYAIPQEPVTVESMTFPDGVRIIAGFCGKKVVGVNVTYEFSFTNFNKNDPKSEIKRHCVGYTDGTTRPQAWNGIQDYTYADVLVFDVVTGEHLVVRAGGGFAPLGGNGNLSGSFQDPKALILTDWKTHENLQLSTLYKPSVQTGMYNNQFTFPSILADVSGDKKKTLPAVIDN
jgi:type II secretory pathway pseudopilin PulG